MPPPPRLTTILPPPDFSPFTPFVFSRHRSMYFDRLAFYSSCTGERVWQGVGCSISRRRGRRRHHPLSLLKLVSAPARSLVISSALADASTPVPEAQISNLRYHERMHAGFGPHATTAHAGGGARCIRSLRPKDTHPRDRGRPSCTVDGGRRTHAPPSLFSPLLPVTPVSQSTAEKGEEKAERALNSKEVQL